MPEEIIKEGQLVGQITHYFSKIGVAVIELSAALKIGDVIAIRGGEADFEQTVDSMEVDRKKVQAARAGESVGLKVSQKVKEGYKVYKL